MKEVPKWILVVALFVGVALIVVATTLYALSEPEIPVDAVDYGITVDASSSKTKFTLYDWKSVKENGTGLVNERASEKLNIRIDKYADNLTNLIVPLRTTLEKVSTRINDTRPSFQVPIYLGATAGMRLLHAINSQDSDKIFKEIRTSFQQYAKDKKKYKVEDVEIISGDKEGLYAWIATNYLMDYVPPRNRPINSTVGVLEMGGASAQIAFQTLCKTKDGCQRNAESTNLVANEKIELFDIEYDVYTYSNLCFGNDEARRRYQFAVIKDQLDDRDSNQIDDPCTHRGQVDRTINKKQILVDVCTINDKTRAALVHDTYVFKARPDMVKCQELTRRLVDPTYVEEHFGGHYVDYKTMEESPPRNMPFYALATYYYAMSQIGLKGKLYFSDENEMRKAIDQYCARSWNDLRAGVHDFDSQVEHIHNYCFAMNYIFVSLKHVYKFSGKQFGNIEFRQKLDRGDLSWTLGYMLYLTSSMTTKEPMFSLSLFLTLLIIGILIALSTAVVFVISKMKSASRRENDENAAARIEFGLSNQQ